MWRDAKWLQGDLKKMTHEQFVRLKQSLLNNQFIMPFNVWANGDLWILDGHHRQKAMLALAAEGYAIPDTLPANFIDCKDKKDAKKLVLIYSSIYARASDETLYGYLHTNDLNFDELKLEMDLRLLCGDSTNADDVIKLLDGVAPHLMVTDPPYGVDYDPSWRIRAGVNLNQKKQGKVQNDGTADWSKAYSLFPCTVAYVWHAGRHAAEVQRSLEVCGFEIRNQIIWAKDRFALSRGDYHWQHEPCWYATKGKHFWGGDRSQSTLWSIKSREDSGHGHGTQKPVECMARPIRNNSNPGQVVVDPFLGSGTTLIAAEQTGRVCFGMEIDPLYCDVIVSRWCALVGQNGVNVNNKTVAWNVAEVQ